MNHYKASKFVVLFSLSFLATVKIFAQAPLPCYANGVPYNSGGSSTNHMATADFNNDGNADLLIANFGGNNISLLLGSGTGTFGAATNFNTGTSPIDLVTGDFNNDGNKDVITSNLGGNNISVFLGNGLGSFATAVNYLAGGAPYGITTADINGDGNLDIAVSNTGGSSISILMGSATGTFATAVPYGVGLNPLGIAFSDLNNDGNQDLAVCNNALNFSVLMGSATGTFASSVNYSLSAIPRDLCAFDFNADGNKDLAFVSSSGNSLEILLGSSTGTFAFSTVYGTPSVPFDIIPGDFNNDDLPDLAIACQTSNSLSIWTSSGTGTFALGSNYLTGSLPRGVCSADFNSDGEADLATANNGSNNSSVFLSCAPGAALNLNGSPYITKTSIAFGTTWTAEAWIRPTNVSGTFWKTVLGQMFWNNNQGFVIRIYNNLVGLEAPGGVFIDAPITANVWTHVAAVYENGIYRFYKDGLLVGARVASFSSSSNPFYIGVRANNNNVGLVDAYIGDIDEVRIWNTARTGCQIQTFMNCEIPTIATGLIANHHFNQGYGSSGNALVTQLKDASASASNGTLVGFTLSGGTNNWIAAGAMANSYSISAPPTATIGVTGNGNTITNNSASTSTLNFTDFGTSLTSTFVVTNTTAGTLNVGTPIFTGGNASEFTVTVLPAATLAASGTTSFVVACSPTSIGVKTTSVNIFNNDCVLPQFRFAIQCTATAGSALYFDNSNDYVSSLPSVNLNNEFTIEFWAKRNSNTSQDFVFAQGIPATDQGLHIGFYSGGNVFNFGFYNDDLTYSGADLNWHHWACVYKSTGQGKNRFLYRDGILVASDLSTGLYTGNGNFIIGTTIWNAAFDVIDGPIDELRVWNVARSQCDIQSYMNCEIPSTATGLLANFHFNQGIAGANNSTVTTVINSTGSGNGTLFNFGLNGTTSNWMNPGGVTSGFTTPILPTATIAVTGNGNSIVHGSTSTSTLNGTNLGTNTVQTYVIQNSGSGTLTIPNVYITGATGGQFTVTALTGSLLGSAATASLSIAFTSSAVGTASAVLNIMSSDCTSPTFSFVVNATTNPASAFALDGTNDYIQFTDPNLGTSDFTIETWFKPNNNNSSYLITTRSGEPGPTGNWWALGCNSTVFFEMAASVGNYSAFSTPTNMIAPGNWYHAAVVRSNSVVSIYLNGILQGQVTETVTRNFVTGNNSLRIGGWPNFNAAWFNGQMDETRIWNVARTQCQIQQFMNCEIPTTATGLLANYHFNQGLPSGNNTASTNVIDAVGAFNGNLVNTTRTGATSNWVSPGGVVNGFTTSTLPTATISVFGNGNSIPMGTTTSTNNFTDFGTNTTRTLVIQNSGVSALNVGAITFSGSTGGQFTVSTLPSTNIVSAGTSSFVILFTPTVVGTASTIVRISSNDCTNPTYSFVITASPSPASALNFDGVNDFVSVAHTNSLNAYPITVETWFKSAYTGSVAAALVNKYISNSLNGWQIYLKNGFLEGFYFKDASNHIAFPISATPFVADNNWHHVAMVVDANGGRLYVDGILSSPFNGWIGTPGPPSTSTGMNLGAYDAMFSGSLDEVRVWNSARTQCEIQQFMNCEIAAPSTGLMANYHFNQGLNGGNNSGVTTLFDATGANNGILLGFALTGSGSNWTSPSNIANNFTTNVAPAAIFSVTGNGNNVPQGSTTTTLNGTSFGTLTAQTFSAYNAGTGTLQINTIYFTGPNASQFSVTSAPVSTLTTVGSTFAITLTPTVTGVHSATVNVITNDCTNPTFTFVITSTVNPASALNLDGSNDYIGLGMAITNSLSTLNKITAEAWVYPTNTSFNGVIVGNYGSPSNQLQFLLRRDGTGYSFFIGNGNGGNYNGLIAPNTVSLNTWQHLAGVWDGLNLYLYINGQLVSTGTATYATFGTASNSVVIGYNTVPEPFAGSIDEVRIWGTNRSQCQIQQFMSAEIPTTATNLIANYHFNQGIPSGTNTAVITLTDAATANTGTLNSFALTGPNSNWISPGAIANGFTTAIAPSANFSLTGNGNNVPMGSTTTTLNGTNFSTLTTQTFSVYNAGTGTLNINTIYFTGPNAAQFSVTIAPASLLTTGGSSFVITLTPTNTGISTATVNIPTNDCANPTFSFVITASTSPAGALKLDGVDDVVLLPVNLTSDFTIEYWFKTNNAGTTFPPQWRAGSGMVDAYNSPVSLNGYGTALYGPFASFGVGNPEYSLFSSSNVVTGNWVHLAASWKQSTGEMKLYVNGILEAQGFSPGTAARTSTIMAIGRILQGGSPNSNIFIDELRLWNSVRTQCEVQTFMNAEITSTASGLVSNYHFNQGLPGGANPTNTLLIDAAGASTGTLSNFALTGTVSNWVSPGAVVNGFTNTVAPNSSISVSGNGNSIANGAVTTTTLNHTSFGSASSRTFVISNPGTTALNISTPVLTGSNSTEFTVTLVSTLTIPAGGTGSFVIAFTPTAGGLKSTIVNITSNYCTIPNFSFVIDGTPPPAAAFYFDGVNDYAQGPIFSTATNSVTIQAKVYLTGYHGFHQFIALNGSAPMYGLMMTAGGQLASYNSAFGINTSSYTIPTNTWVSVAVVYKDNVGMLYANGVQTGSFTYASLGTPTGSFLIGANGFYSENFKGAIDEVQFWNRPLSQCEILSNLNSEIPTSASGLLANYHFNQGSANLANPTASTIVDASGNNNHLFIGNTAALSGTISNWISPGAVVSGFTTVSTPSCEINIMANGNNIVDGATSTATLNNTNFGTSMVKTFTIQNTGTTPLYINTPILFSGNNNTEFAMLGMPAASIAAAGSTTFSVAFTPTSTGTKSTTIRIENSDCDEAIYDFVITATTTPGAALHFDDNNDYVYAPAFSTQNNNITFQAKINWEGVSTNNKFVLHNGNSGANGYGMFVAANTNSVMLIYGGINVFNTGYTLTPNVWTSLSGVIETNKLSFYANGVLTSTFAIANPAVPSGSFCVGTGAVFGSETFNGSIDEVLLWHRALTACEIQAYVNSEIPTTGTNLVANYHFNQGIAGGANSTSTVVPDFSGNNYSLTLVNFGLSNTTSNWIAPGGVVSGFTTVTFPGQEINVTGNAASILNKDYFTTVNDFSHFGNGTGVLTRTFVIQNTGTSALTIFSTSITGPQAAEFSLSVAPPSTIAASSSGSFVVSFANNQPGIRSATITILNNDCDEDNYQFAVSGGMTQLYTGRYNASRVAKARTDVTNACNNWMVVTGSSIGTAVDNYNGKVYYSGYGAGNIGVVNQDGSAINNSLLTGQGSVIGMTYDEINQKLFFAVDGPGGIRSVNPNGSGLFAVASVSACYDVAVDPINQKVYYVAFGSNNIGVVNYDGTGHNPNFITGGSSPYGICTDMNAGKLYWASFGGSKIGTANLDGTGVNQNFVTGISGITDLVVDNTTGKLYFTNGNIGSVNINGTGLNNAFQPGIGATWGLALGGYISPTLSLSASANSICPGNSVAITATTNATTYTWSTGPNTTSITVTPTINTTYSLTVTDAQSCTLQATQVITVVSSPEIDLIGNAISIPAGSSTPTLSNHTDFGNISNTGAVVRTFTIQNTGPANLTVSSITLSGVNANQFTVGALSPASPIPSGTFAVFSVTSIPTSTGPKTATITISNNDCNEAAYDFVVTATSTNAACFNFDGNNDYVATNATLTASYTKEAWVKIGASTNGNNFIGGGNGSGGHTIWAPGLAGYSYKLSAGHDFTWNAVQDPTPLNFNTWYHIAVSYDAPSTTMNLYKNGVLVASSNTVQPFTGAYPVALASYGGSFSINGSMDEVRIWNRALCQSEIVNNMNCEIPTSANGLLANYHFNQGIASGLNATLTNVTDASGNNNNGTLANVALSGTVSNWIEPGAVVSGSACSTITIPEINLVGNGVTINDGDINPSSTDHTDFGAVCIGGNIVRTFTIQNTGTAPLTVGTISLGGTNANLFSVGALSPASPVSAGGSAVFSVTYTPLTAGVSSPTISITNNDCNESPYDVVFTATANALPTVTASASSSVICAGFTTSLIGSGANTYTWSGSASNNTAFSPTVTTSYTVNGTNTLTGCTSTNSAVQTITVNAIPTVTANTTASVVCFGGTVTLSGSGANTYTWTGGVTDGVSFTPTSTTTYTLSGTSLAGCTNTNLAVQTITVNALPVVAVPGGSICSGQSFTLTPTGAFTYTYSTGPVVSPSITTSYSVTGTGTNGCVTGTAAVVTITVDTTPTVSVNSGTICYGQSFTIVPTGANSYTVQGNNTVVSPTISSTYTLIGSSAAGCLSANTETSSVFVNSLPNVVIKATDTVICYGKSVTLSGAGANTYTWTNGVIDNTAFSPTTTATYSVIGTNTNGCENFASVTVTVNSLPSLTISSSNTLACAGETIQLTGAGANTFTWSSSETTSVITITLSTVSDVTLTGTDANGCTNTGIFTQSITPCSGTFAVVPMLSNVSCRDKNDGRIDVTPILTFTNNKINYYWSPASLCPNNDCAQVENLKAGTYSVTVKVIYTVTSTFVKNDSTSIAMTIKDENPPCNLIVYTGVTPNNDGVNDVWKIENIELYPNNHIQVFNRWGNKVMDIKGYNNNTKSWPTTEEFKSLTPSTYFYIIDLGDNSPPVKGWLEIMGN